MKIKLKMSKQERRAQRNRELLRQAPDRRAELNRQFAEERARLDRIVERYNATKSKRTTPCIKPENIEPWERKRQIWTRRGWRAA
jgi:hypothetical protein